MAEDDSQETTPVEFRVYQEAHEESFLWEILASGEDHRFGDVLIYQALSRDDVTPTLLAALGQGDMSLYIMDFSANESSEYPEIARDEAVRIVQDPTYWDWKTAPAKVCLRISDSGEERFRTMEMPEFERRPKL